MNYRPSDLDRMARQLVREIEDQISKAGIFYRIFFRCKTPHSLAKKIAAKNSDQSPKYVAGQKGLRDAIGIRLNLYFIDDLILVTQHLKNHFSDFFVEETIDPNTTTEFKPQRINIIFKLPDGHLNEFRQVLHDARIDATFELQLRTILSEGWHEVEHDLRYKCPDDWEEFGEMSRIFNGFLATLETQEWSMVHFFDRFSYSQYKIENIRACIRSKLRIRFEDVTLSVTIQSVLDQNDNFSKLFFKLEREKIIDFLLTLPSAIPITLENVIYLINYQFIFDKAISVCAPPGILEYFKDLGTVDSREVSI